MELLDLVLSLLKKFTPITDNQLAALESELRSWRSKAQEDPVEKEKPFSKFYMKVNDGPWWRLIWTVSFIPIVKYMQAVPRKGDEDDEEM